MLKQSTSVNFQDWHLGYKVEHDTNKVKSLVAQLALKNEKGTFFGKFDVLTKQILLGCSHQYSSKCLHAFELAYSLNKTAP